MPAIKGKTISKNEVMSEHGVIYKIDHNMKPKTKIWILFDNKGVIKNIIPMDEEDQYIHK